MRIAGFFLTLVMVVAIGADSYQSSMEAWRSKREAALKADDGWLTVTGLFWLKDGVNRCGADPSGEIALPEGSAPAHVGTFELHNGATTFRAEPGVATVVNGKPAASVRLKSDTDGKPDQVTIGDLTMFVIHRGTRYAIRLRDKNSKLRKEFTALHWYPVREEYRVTAKFVSYDTPHHLTVPNILDETEEQPSPGYAVFNLEGHEYRLHPVLEDNQLFFIFRDLTSGKETYPSGRFLYADLPKDGKVTLDFNKAYNPPCAFTPYATCPLPPPQNRLQIRIEAGELTYGHH